jgi:hypothetical protein
MRSILCTFRSELKEIIQRQMRASIQSVQSELDETTTCREVTETVPEPGMMQSKEKHQEIPKEETAVMPVGEPRKRRRVCNLAAERRQKRKERTQGNCGSRRKSAATCRKVSHCAKVAWRKRNLFRNVQTQRKCGPWKELGTGNRLTHRAEVGRSKEHGLQRQVKDNSAPRTLTERTSRMSR